MEEPEAHQPKQYLIGTIHETLAHDSRVNELNVQATVTGKKIFLTGTVATQERRDAIADVVEELLPDYEVHNETTVGSFSDPAEPEELT